MSRPTKEEGRGWAALVASRIENGTQLTEEEVCQLRNWLGRVARALPTAAAVQRDQERRTPCSLCGVRDGLHREHCERNPARRAD